MDAVCLFAYVIYLTYNLKELIRPKGFTNRWESDPQNSTPIEYFMIYLRLFEQISWQEGEGEVRLKGSRRRQEFTHLEEDPVLWVSAGTHFLETLHQWMVRTDGRNVLGPQQRVHSVEHRNNCSDSCICNDIYIYADDEVHSNTE